MKMQTKPRANLPPGTLAMLGRMLERNVDLVSALEIIEGIWRSIEEETAKSGLLRRFFNRRKGILPVDSLGELIERMIAGGAFAPNLVELFETSESYLPRLQAAEASGRMGPILTFFETSLSEPRSRFSLGFSPEGATLMDQALTAALEARVSRIEFVRGPDFIDAILLGQSEPLRELQSDATLLRSRWQASLRRLAVLLEAHPPDSMASHVTRPDHVLMQSETEVVVLRVDGMRQGMGDRIVIEIERREIDPEVADLYLDWIFYGS